MDTSAAVACPLTHRRGCRQVNLEQRLMEGSYNKILTARSSVPHPLMGFFVDLLAKTVRYDHRTARRARALQQRIDID